MKLKDQSRQLENVARMVNGEGDVDAMMLKIEGMDFLGRETWAKAASIWANEMVKAVYANGTDQAFIEAVKTKSGKVGEMTFDQAADIFRDMMDEAAKRGIKGTVLLAREVDTAANGKHAEILKPENRRRYP